MSYPKDHVFYQGVSICSSVTKSASLCNIAQKNWSFPLRISSVSVTKSAVCATLTTLSPLISPHPSLNSSVLSQKGESQNWCFKKTKHAKFSEKWTFVTPWCARTYQGVRNVRFSENLACFVFLKHPFWDSPFCLITEEFYPLKISFENFLTRAWSMFPFYKPKNTRWDLVFWCFQVE